MRQWCCVSDGHENERIIAIRVQNDIRLIGGKFFFHFQEAEKSDLVEKWEEETSWFN